MGCVRMTGLEGGHAQSSSWCLMRRNALNSNKSLPGVFSVTTVILHLFALRTCHLLNLIRYHPDKG